jgi:2,4-dichlorophenol 6-monooxygenase
VGVPDADTAWRGARQIGDTGAVLVRPDRKVAWRVADMPDAAPAALASALAVILRGGDEPADDPAEPYLQRIRAAADVLVR